MVDQRPRLYQLESLQADTVEVIRITAMFVLRAAGCTLLVYALFNAAFGLNRQELPWLLAAVLLTIGGLALLAARSWSRLVVLASAAAAAVVGAISQFRTAQDIEISLESATVAWALWSALWLATAYIGARYLTDEGVVSEP
jgi:hypothetical protein